MLVSSAVVSGATVNGVENTPPPEQTTTPAVDSLTDEESKVIQSYLQSEQVGYISDAITVDGNEYIGVLVVRANGVPTELRNGDPGAYAAGYYSERYWGKSAIRNILVFEKTNSGVQLVTDTDTISRVLEARTGQELADFYSQATIEPWISDWIDRVVYSSGSNIAFGWEKVSRLESREDAYLAALQGMTTTGSQVQYIPDSVRDQIKSAETPAEAASIATDLAGRYEVGSKIEVAGEAVDSQKTKQALQKFSDDITYISENADKVAYAGSLVSLVLAVSEQQVYADYKIERFKRVQEYARSSPNVALDDDLDGAITRLVDQHEDSGQKTREALLTWIDTSSVDLATTAAPTVAQKFGSWVATKSSYAASASTYATSGTAGTLLSGAASVAGAGLAGWQIGGVLINRQGMYVTMKRAEFSQKTMNELGNVADTALGTHGAEFKHSGSVDAAEARVFYSAASLEKLAQLQTYRYVSESFDSTWVDERLGDVEELIRLLEGNEYVSDEQVVEDTVNQTEKQYGRWNQTTIGETLAAYPTEPKTVASLSSSISSTVISPNDVLGVEAAVTDRSGQSVGADEVSYEIVETGKSGSLIGQNGDYSYGVEVPETTGEYTVRISAQINDQTLSKTEQFTVSDGDIGISTGTISGKAFPGETVSQQLRITNNGETTLSNVVLSEEGPQRDWISVSSSEPDWRARSQSFELIQPASNEARTVTVNIAVPTSADQGSYSGKVTIATASGGSVEVPVSVSVTEQSDRFAQEDDNLYDSGPDGRDVSAEVMRDRTVPEWTDAGHSDTIRASSVTIDDSWTEVGSFSANDVGIDEMDHWIATDIDWTAGPDAEDGYLQIRINGKTNEETHRVSWGGLNAQPYHLEDDQIPTVTRDENTVEFKYVHSDRSSVTVSDVVVDPETAELDQRVWADDANIESEELATVRSAYVSLDAKAMSDATAHPLRVYVNGEFQGTVSAPYGEWSEEQRVAVDTAALSTDPDIEIRTRPKGIYNLDDVELVYSYIEPADIDTDLSTDEVSVAKGEQFTLSGAILNDGGTAATDTEYSLSYDNSLLTLVRGSDSGSLGTLTAGESERQVWTFKAESGGSTSITLTGDAETSDESASASITIPTYGVTVAGPESVTTDSDTTTATFTVTNTGSVKETINLDVAPTAAPPEWETTLDQQRISIRAGESAQVTVSIAASRVGQGAVAVTATPSATSQTATKTVAVTRELGPDETAPSVRLNAPKTVTEPTAAVSWVGIDNRDPQETLVYSYRVGGPKAPWSAWTESTATTLTDLTVGTQNVTVRAKDSAGNIGSATAGIQFNPSPKAALSVSDSKVEAGSEVVLNASGSSDPTDDNLSYTWDLDGDGTFDKSGGDTIRRSFESPGQYEVLVQVSDGKSTDTARVTVTVAPPDGQLNPILAVTSPSAETPATVSEPSTTVSVKAQISYNGSRSQQTIQEELDKITTGGRAIIGTELASIRTVSVESLRNNVTANRWVAQLEATVTTPPLPDGVYDLQVSFPVTKNCQQICTQEVRTVTDTAENTIHVTDTTETGTLVVNAASPDAVVNVDGEVVGTGNQSLTLTAGEHTLRVTKTDFEPVNRTVNVAVDQTTTTTVSLSPKPATISVSTNVSTATVAIEGTEIGPTPVSVKRSPGEYEVVVRADGYQTVTRTVALSPNERHRVAVNLEPESEADNEPPEASVTANRTLVTSGGAVSLDANGSSDNVGIVSYNWDTDGDGTYETTGKRVSKAYSEPGTTTVKLRVEDAAGNTDTDTVDVSVEDTTDPRAVVGPDRTVSSGETVRLDGSDSIDNIGIVDYHWDVDGDGGYEEAGAKVTTTFSTAGTKTVKLQVRDAAGNTDTDTVTIQVDEPASPTVTAEAGGPYFVTAAGAVELNASASTASDTEIVETNWELLNGPGAVEDNTYQAPDTLADDQTARVQLTVTEVNGGTDTDRARIDLDQQSDPSDPSPGLNLSNLSVGGTATPTTIDVGTNTTIEAVVQNPTETETTVTTTLLIGQIPATQETTVSPDSTELVQFTNVTGKLAAGNYTLTLQTQQENVTLRGNLTVRDAAMDPPAGSIKHAKNLAAAVFSTGDAGEVAAEQLVIAAGTNESLTIGGSTGRTIEIRHPETGRQLTVSPAIDSAVTADAFALDVYAADGTLSDDPALTNLQTGERIPAQISGDDNIFTDIDGPFAAYSLTLRDDGEVVDTTATRQIGIGYPNLFEQNATNGTITITLPRDDAVSEDWTAEFDLEATADGGPLVSRDIDHTAQDDVFSVTINSSDIEQGIYDSRITLEKAANESGGFDRLIAIASQDAIIIGDPADIAPTVNVTADDTVTRGSPVQLTAYLEDRVPETAAVTVENSEGEVVFTQNVTKTFQNPGVLSRAIDWAPVNQTGALLPDGKYTAVATAEDEFGNQVNATKTIAVDTSPPAIDSVGVVSGPETTTDDSIVLGANITSAPSDLATVELGVTAEAVAYTQTTIINSTEIAQQFTGNRVEMTVDPATLAAAVGEGNFTVTARATDTAGNTGVVTNDTVTVDTSVADAQARVTGLGTTQAALQVTADENVSVTNVEITAKGADGTTEDRTPDSRQTPSTTATAFAIPFDAATVGEQDTTFTATVKLEDAAGNTETATVNASVTGYELTNGEAEVDPNGTDAAFNLSATSTTANGSRSATVGQTAMPPAGTELAADQIASTFIDVTDIGLTEAELQNATVRIPVETIDIEGASAEELVYFYSPDGRDEYQVLEPEVDDGELVVEVDGFSQLAPGRVDDQPPTVSITTRETPQPNATLEVSYADELSAVNVSSVDISVNGDTVTAADGLQVTASNATYTLAEGSAAGATVSVKVTDKAGNTAEKTRTLQDGQTRSTVTDVSGLDGTTVANDTDTVELQYESASDSLDREDTTLRIIADGSTSRVLPVVDEDQISYELEVSEGTNYTAELTVTNEAGETRTTTRFSVARGAPAGSGDNQAGGGGGAGSMPNSEESTTQAELFEFESETTVRLSEIPRSGSADIDTSGVVTGGPFDLTRVQMQFRFDVPDFRLEITDPRSEASAAPRLPDAAGTPVGFLEVDAIGADQATVDRTAATLAVDEGAVPDGRATSELIGYQYVDGEWRSLATDARGGTLTVTLATHEAEHIALAVESETDADPDASDETDATNETASNGDTDSDENESATPPSDQTPDDESSDEIPGFGALTAIGALLTLLLYSRVRRQH